MPEPKARKLAIAVLAVLVVIIVIPAVALFVRGGGDQPVQIILPTPGGTDGKLHVYFLDVGQGDSILIVTPTENRCWWTVDRI